MSDRLIKSLSYLSRVLMLFILIMVIIKINPFKTDNVWITVLGVYILILSFGSFCIITYRFLLNIFN